MDICQTTKNSINTTVKTVDQGYGTEYRIIGPVSENEAIQAKIDRIFEEYPSNPYFTWIDQDYTENNVRHVVITRSNTSD